MITITKTISPKLFLTKGQIARINRAIMPTDNIYNACEYAGINFRTLKKAVKMESAIKEIQRDKLLQFCDIIEGKSAA